MLEDVMAELETLGTAQNRKIYARHGITNAMFGLSYANLGKLSKKFKGQQALALDLWATNNHDAKILATMIVDAKQLDKETIKRWSQELGNYVISDAFAKVVAGSPYAKHLMHDWLESDDEWQGQVAWILVSSQASQDKSLSDSYFKTYIEKVKSSIHEQKNRVKHAMNMALISIGVRSPELEALVLEAADSIGNIDVDHGQTGCKTPAIADYIKKTLKRKGYVISKEVSLG